MQDCEHPPKPTDAAAEDNRHRVLVWDLPTRIFHWLLVILVVISLTTGLVGGIAMEGHERSGAAILVLILFRVVWGFVGCRQARFGSFIRGPVQVAGYLRSFLGPDATRYLGHNPLGGWSIVAMLTALAVQVTTGLFANDDILTEGPLYHWVAPETSSWLTGVHRVNANILIALIAIHLAAIVFYLVVKRENLIWPMITGYKRWPELGNPKPSSTLLALILVAVFAVLVYWVLY